MTKTNGLVLAAFLMASTSPMAIGQTTTTPDTGTDMQTGTEPTPLPGDSPTDINPAPMPGDTPTDMDTEPAPLPGTESPTTGTDTMTDTGMSADGTASTADMDHLLIITQMSLPSAAGVDWEEEFTNLSDDAEVNIVTLSDLADADDTASPMLDQAMTNLDNDQDALRSAIENNDALMSALEDEDYTVDQVVAALMGQEAEAGVTLVVDTEMSSDDAESDDEAEGDSDSEEEAGE